MSLDDSLAEKSTTSILKPLILVEREFYKSFSGEIVQITGKTGLAITLFTDHLGRTYRESGVCISPMDQTLDLVEYVTKDAIAPAPIKPFLHWGFDVEISPLDKFRIIAAAGIICIDIQRGVGVELVLRRIFPNGNTNRSQPFDVRMISKAQRNEIIWQLNESDYRQEDIAKLLGINQSTVSKALSDQLKSRNEARPTPPPMQTIRRGLGGL